MSPAARKGLIVAALHLAIVMSLGAKLLVDRATRPRVWARAAPIDPDLPIRGRYVRLRIEGNLDPTAPVRSQFSPVALEARHDTLIVVAKETTTGVTAHPAQRDGQPVAVLDQALAYFIPEHVPDPSRRPAGEELWVEVTLPGHGAPRPIRLGIRKEGVLQPLDLR